MKALSMACAVALVVGGCADPMEQRSGSEVQDQLERGVTGQGSIGPEQREPGDPAAEHGVPQTHP
jgi:hypothetical protein